MVTESTFTVKTLSHLDYFGSTGFEMIKSAEPRSLFLVSLFQRNLSCVLICEDGCEFKRSRILYLVKMNCHVCLTDTYNEISVGTYQRGHVGNKRGANPLTLL